MNFFLFAVNAFPAAALALALAHAPAPAPAPAPALKVIFA